MSTHPAENHDLDEQALDEQALDGTASDDATASLTASRPRHPLRDLMGTPLEGAYHIGQAFAYGERLDQLAAPNKTSVITKTIGKASRRPMDRWPRMAEIGERAYDKIVGGNSRQKALAHGLLQRWRYACSRVGLIPQYLSTEQRYAFWQGYQSAQGTADWLQKRLGPTVNETAPQLPN